MKTKRAFVAITAAAVIVVIVLISLRAYYVTVALVAGTLIMGYREIWSLMRRQKLPPIDERVKENTSRSIRNGFLFFAGASAFLMLPFSVALIETPDTVHVLGGLFVAAGVVYLLSYLFYDRVEPRLSEKESRLLRIFLLVAGGSLALGIVSIFLHNAVYGLLIQWFGADFWDRTGMADEPVFFLIAILVAPLGLAVGIIGGLVVFLKGLFGRAS